MRMKAIINPVSGQNYMRRATREAVKAVQRDHLLHDSDIFYTLGDKSTEPPVSFWEDCDAVMVAGGDGTLHYAINHMKNCGIDRPLAYLPTGTSNDFGHGMNLPRTVQDFCQMLHQENTRKVDLGLIGGEYFHYVVAGGTMTAVSYNTGQYLKNKLGYGAYYLSFLSSAGRLLSGFPIKIKSEEICVESNAILFLVSNSPIVGGFQYILPEARFDDGYLHVLVLRKNKLYKSAQLFLEIIQGRHMKNPDVLYFKTKKLHITQPSGSLGVDGERLEVSSATIEVVPHGMTLFVPPVSPTILVA